MALKTFDQILVDSSDAALTALGEETKATYQPGVLDREIQLIIRYVTDDGEVASGARHRSSIVHITVKNDSGDGISAAEFEQGQVINMPPRKGASAREFRLARIVKQDAGLITIEVH